VKQNKNINSGNINTEGGSVNIGDTIVQISPKYNEYLKRIDQLKDLNKFCPEGEKKEKYRADLQEVTEGFENYKKKIIDLAETFQKIEINTERLKIAKQYFDAGKFKEAQEALDKEQMSSDLNLLLREKKKLEIKNEDNKKKLRQNSEEFLISAKLADLDLSIDNRFTVVKDLYEKSLKADENCYNLYSLGVFLQKNSQHNEAKFFFNKVLDLYKKIGEDRREEDYINNANAFINLGTILKDQEKHELSKKQYLKAIDICLKKVKKNTPVQKYIIAVSYQSIGNLFNGTLDSNRSNDYYQKALNSYNELPSDMYLLEKAILYTNLGTLSFRKKDNLKKAEGYYDKALNLYENLNVIFTDKDYRCNVAGLLNNKSQIASALGDKENAEKLLFETLEIYRELVKRDYYKITPNIAGVLGNLGVVLKQQKKYTEAETYYLESIDLYRKLSETNPEVYRKDEARVLSNIANFYAIQNKGEKAIKYYELSILKYKLLRDENVLKFSHLLLLTLSDYGVFRKKRGEIDDAGQLYKEALSLLEDMQPISQKNQPLYSYIGILSVNMASFYNKKNNKEKVIKCINEAIKYLEKTKEGEKEKESFNVIKQILVDLGIDSMKYLNDKGLDDSYIKAL